MSAHWLGWLAAGLAVVACATAAAARSLAGFAPSELGELGRRRNRPRRLAEIVRRRAAAVMALDSLAVLLGLGYVAAAFAAASGSASFTWPHWPGWAAAAGVLLGLLALLLWVPDAFARLWGTGYLFFTWPFWRTVAVAAAPLVWMSSIVRGAISRLAGRPLEEADEESFEEDIRTFVSEGHREGLLEEDAREMIEGVIDLGEADVSEIMTPRTDMISMPFTLSWPEAMQFVVNAGHTRIPVFNKTRDDIVGILHAKDLLPPLARCQGAPAEPWTTLLRAPFFVPETKKIDTLLADFQRTRNHIAIVLDEYGGVSGLVTLEDVLEEIVGEIVDEYDHEQVEWIKPLGDGVCEALGRARLDEINERTGLALPEEEEFDTIGGFVFHELGRVPTAGEQLVWRNARITVLEASPRRIEKVRIEVIDRGQESAAAANDEAATT